MGCHKLAWRHLYWRILRYNVANGFWSNADDTSTRQGSATPARTRSIDAFIYLEYLHDYLRQAENPQEPQQHTVVIIEFVFIVDFSVPFGTVTPEHGGAINVADSAIEQQRRAEKGKRIVPEDEWDRDTPVGTLFDIP